ncbi:coiled-coil-helix-coiled-coil-helix domain containing 6b isoform X2 [Denticeps clupeoides]|uniref:Uncharacterized protein n=1 Tax=Denticeps clupeoides TaxID=299321 RepID=A0AAY4ERA2_9TELE|nr:MICOS complex subunit mic25a-like isoform X2 [Denticeps clupeoides]
MGGGESTTRRASFGLDEDDNVTVLHGIKLSSDVLQRMRGPDKEPQAKKPESPTPDPAPTPGPSPSDVQEELRRRYEREQALIQEELARIARREREAGQESVSAAVLRERAKTREEMEKAHRLAKQLDRKEAELKQLTAFYKEQLQLLEKKNLEQYQQTSEHYRQEATKAEARILPRHTAPICAALQSQVLRCYKENRHQTLACSSLAKEYMNCISTAKKNTMVNHGA